MNQFDEEAIKSYLKAGKISADVKKRAKAIIKEGARLLDIAEEIERSIKEQGGDLAFPVNLSFGNIAAHYSPIAYSMDKLEGKGILKVDIGVHVGGYIADTAISIDLSGENEDLVKASEEAIERVKNTIYPGIKISQLSEIIEKTIRSYGAVPIRNLTGHGLDRYKLHTGLSIPNVNTFGIRGSLQKNSAVAIEPFATRGTGYVVDGDFIGIYSLHNIPSKKLKGLTEDAKNLYEIIFNERRELPFSERWYVSKIALVKFRDSLSELVNKGVAQEYPVLIEVSGSQVAQYEESFLLLDREVIAYTAEK